MKTKHKIIICILAAIGAILLFLGIRFYTQSVSSIGIIRAADGPTAIFLAGKIPSGFNIFIIIGVVCLIACLVKLFWKKK